MVATQAPSSNTDSLNSFNCMKLPISGCSGFVGGQHYTHTGGGSNYICLPLKPEWSKYDLGTFGNYIYGTEYELSGSQASLFSNRLQDNNVPCAQCYSNTRSITIMMPAKLTCPLGWTKVRGHM